LPSGGKKTPQILSIFGLQHFVVSPFGGNLTKLNTRAQLQTFPIKQYQNRFCNLMPHRKIVQTNPDVQKHGRQTDRQKNSTFVAALASGEIRS